MLIYIYKIIKELSKINILFGLKRQIYIYELSKDNE